MNGDTLIPDLKWYEKVTKRKGLKEPRCPFASVEKCPRYYQSLSLLGMAGATAIDKREDKKLQKKWEHHFLWPKTREQETSIGGPEEQPHIYSRFCPEVSHEAFGLFADFLAGYADELDAELASQQLGEMGAPSDDWHWAWQQVSPMHYADCPLYSPLLHDATNSAEKKWWEKPVGIVTLGILIAVIGGLILWGITHHYDKVSSPVPVAEHPKAQSETQTAKPLDATKPSSEPQQGVRQKKGMAPTPGTTPAKVEINAPNGIAIGGGIVNSPTVNNFGPQEAQLSWASATDIPQPKGAGHPRTFAKIWVDRPWENPKLLVFCDRPCRALGFQIEGEFRSCPGTIPNSPNLGGFIILLPNPLPSGLKGLISVESADDTPVKILNVTKLAIKGPINPPCE